MNNDPNTKENLSKLVDKIKDVKIAMMTTVDDDGTVGFRARRSHDVVALPEVGCLIAAPGPEAAELTRVARPGSDLEVTVADDVTVVIATPAEARRPVHQEVRGRTYAVDAGGMLRWVTSEAQAIRLYGTDWAKRVVDVADTFFGNYVMGPALSELDAAPSVNPNILYPY